MREIESHTRVNDILLGPLERPALRWLAAHMPGWVTPDILTGIGILGAFLIALGYGLSNYHPAYLWLASFSFLVSWFGDSLDGTLARYRKIERPKLGFYIDHTVDAFTEVVIFLGLGLSPYVRFDLACLALIGYLLLSILVYIRTAVMGEFVISYGKLGPTEVRVLAVIANTLVFTFGNATFQVGPQTFTAFDAAVAVVALVLYIIFLTSAVQQLPKIAALEKKEESP